MNKIRNTFLRILVLILTTVNIGCEKDIINPNEEESIIISEEQFDFHPEFNSVIKKGSPLIESNHKLRNKLQSFSNNQNSRNLYSDVYGFSIDTVVVQHIEAELYDSYTFSVKRDTLNSNYLENYVLTLFEDGSAKQHLISYPTNVDNTFDLINANITVIEDPDLMVMSCPWGSSIMQFEDPVCTDNLCQNNGGEQHTVADGSQCNLWGTIYMATQTCTEGGWIEVCTSGAGTGTSGGTGGGGGTGNGANNDPDPNDPDPVVVTPLTPVAAILDCINGPIGLNGQDTTTIDPTLFGTLNSNLNLSTLQAIVNYLNSNGCSEEAQQEIIDIVEAINNGVGSTDSPHFFVRCDSFEYAAPPGVTARSAAVLGVGFVVWGLYPDAYFYSVEFATIPLYFNMPLTMTNGLAQNLTAEAVFIAIVETDAIISVNPEAYYNPFVRADLLLAQINSAMGTFGGSVSRVPTFEIQFPSQYSTSSNPVHMANCN